METALVACSILPQGLPVFWVRWRACPHTYNQLYEMPVGWLHPTPEWDRWRRDFHEICILDPDVTP
jgi:hypothetical protein